MPSIQKLSNIQDPQSFWDGYFFDTDDLNPSWMQDWSWVEHCSTMAQALLQHPKGALALKKALRDSIKYNTIHQMDMKAIHWMEQQLEPFTLENVWNEYSASRESWLLLRGFVHKYHARYGQAPHWWGAMHHTFWNELSTHSNTHYLPIPFLWKTGLPWLPCDNDWMNALPASVYFASIQNNPQKWERANEQQYNHLKDIKSEMVNKVLELREAFEHPVLQLDADSQEAWLTFSFTRMPWSIIQRLLVKKTALKSPLDQGTGLAWVAAYPKSHTEQLALVWDMRHHPTIQRALLESCPPYGAEDPKHWNCLFDAVNALFDNSGANYDMTPFRTWFQDRLQQEENSFLEWLAEKKGAQWRFRLLRATLSNSTVEPIIPQSEIQMCKTFSDEQRIQWERLCQKQVQALIQKNFNPKEQITATQHWLQHFEPLFAAPATHEREKSQPKNRL